MSREMLRWMSGAVVLLVAFMTTMQAMTVGVEAQVEPEVLHPDLAVRTIVSGLNQPTSMAFLGKGDFLILEKATGKVLRVVNGVVQATVLDLAVNSGSERGLLGIVLHPKFARNGFVYLYWTESSTGADTTVLSETPLLGNRVDRFMWNGATLAFDRNILRIRAIQQDANQPERGNHDGGVLKFGPDGKLYVFIGDLGRRGMMQNLRNGPFGPGVPDDQFGGPEPDDAHLSGVILRLNADGTTPRDNPFFDTFCTKANIARGCERGDEDDEDEDDEDEEERSNASGDEVTANVRKIFSYGHRNSFGMAFDPRSGDLWVQENGDDTFSELNRVEPGMNGGWVQIMGPVARIAQFKGIETSQDRDPLLRNVYFGLQQVRWPPTNIADSKREALSRLAMLPEAHYSDPEFSWKFEVAPAGIGFVVGRGLGRDLEGDLILGSARTFLEGGHLFRMELTRDRERIAVDDSRLRDRVADNNHKFDITESESLLFGRNFGICTDVQTGPGGTLFLVSLSNGAVYEIFRRK